MKMKSIRLDFPAEGISLSNQQIINMLVDALVEAKNQAYKQRRLGEEDCARSMERAAMVAKVDEYDDRHGSPVFYIP